MKYSHSRVECYEHCHYKHELRYVKKLLTIPTDDASSPLIVGTAMHYGIENDIKSAIRSYYMSYPIITNNHVVEGIKLEYTIPKVKKLISEVCTGNLTFEYKLDCKTFIGYIDLLEEVKSGVYKIYDFKYSNNEEHYLKSRQLHVYKHYFESITGFKVIELNYLMIPKVSIRQKKTESELEFKQRLIDELSKVNPYIVKVNYDIEMVIEHKKIVEEMETNYKTDKRFQATCSRFCEYFNYCQSNGEIDYDILYPENK